MEHLKTTKIPKNQQMQHPNCNETPNRRENLILWIFLKDLKNLILGIKRLKKIKTFHSLNLEAKQNKNNKMSFKEGYRLELASAHTFFPGDWRYPAS